MGAVELSDAVWLQTPSYNHDILLCLVTGLKAFLSQNPSVPTPCLPDLGGLPQQLWGLDQGPHEAPQFHPLNRDY